MNIETKATPQQAPEQFRIKIDQKALASAYASGAYSELVKIMVRWLSTFAKTRIQELAPAQCAAFDSTAESVAYYLTREDFQCSKQEFLQLLVHHPALSNLFAISSYRNADAWLRPLLRYGKPSLTLMPLNTVRSDIPPARRAFFDLDPLLASEWYGQYFFGVRAFANATALQNLRDHLAFWDDRMQLRVSVSNGYMRSTYIGRDLDRLWKFRFNQLARKSLTGIKIQNKPDFKKIAIVTGRWAKVHPTYKNRYPLFEALAKKYELTLIHIGHGRKDLETGIFQNVHGAAFQGYQLKAPELFNNNFGMVFYPDIGMNIESRFLSNLRLAPIQITTNSHPVSTFGSEIDYFLTGAGSELEPNAAHQFYSERLVLIPGIGTLPVSPTFERPSKNVALNLGPEPATKPVRIGCPWGGLKVNHELIQTLVKIKAQSTRPLIFRFLTTLGVEAGHVPPVRQDLIDILGAGHVELQSDQPYPNYMQALSECDLALDAFPFGGNTSIVDCIVLGIPIVTRKGWQFYNLAGPVMQEHFGQHELVTENEEQYIAKALRLIEEPQYRQSTLALASSKPEIIAQTLEKLTSTDAFLNAMDHLMTKRPDARIRDPLVFA